MIASLGINQRAPTSDHFLFFEQQQVLLPRYVCSTKCDMHARFGEYPQIAGARENRLFLKDQFSLTTST
jgi:hypothetical protein